jgi:tRNA threonylcarbamoyladenosine biosynthesis protein TsaE
MSGSAKSVISHSPNETTQVGAELAKKLVGGDLVLIQGPMGVGKSVLARGILHGLGAEDYRGSPTYALIHEYAGALPVYHVDLYRLSAEEVEQIGLEELARSDSIGWVEWPERGARYLEILAPAVPVRVQMSMMGDGARAIEIDLPSESRQAGLIRAETEP